MAALRARRARQALVLSTIVVAVVGASTMLHIINPRTLLVAPADREALMWISSHTSADARFAVGVQPWLGGSFIGIDGGYWIPLVTGRSSALPPGLYSWVMPAERVRVVTAALAQWSAAQQGGARVSELLRRQGLTHIYFGARNGTMIRQEAASDPSLISVYDAGGVQIYALR